MRNKIKFLESLNDLQMAKRILKEAYGEMNGEMNGRGMDMPSYQAQQQLQGEMGMEGDEETPIADPQMNDIISQIRELAIKGIAQFADQVESEKYQSLKKIWLLTDKFYEDAANENDNKKKF